ncbi:hypothetical protein BT93_I0777 [Corymbia citriodora subsp. variegata]|nr:hypothetical protein BT93_I0777 [Corymbia citriodora subsp. variegata]
MIAEGEKPGEASFFWDFSGFSRRRLKEKKLAKQGGRLGKKETEGREVKKRDRAERKRKRKEKGSSSAAPLIRASSCSSAKKSPTTLLSLLSRTSPLLLLRVPLHPCLPLLT